jgi:hypothetical protein
MTWHIHSAKMECDGLNAPHSNRCKGPISPCQSIQGWNDVLFRCLYGWVDILIKVVSIILKCSVVFSQHLFVGLSWFVAFNIFNCTIASSFLPFCFGHELNLYKFVEQIQSSISSTQNQHLDFVNNDLRT